MERRNRNRYKRNLINILVVLLVIVALGGGYYYLDSHYNKAIAEQGKEAVKKDQEYQQQQIAQRKADIDKLKPNGSPRSYIDDIRYYKAVNQGKVKISTLGSSVTAGAGASDTKHNWSNLLVNYLSNIEGPASITLSENGFGSYSTDMLIAENKVDAVITQKPDIVLFETCLLNDHGTGVPIDKTNQNISSIVNKIHSALPETKIILMSPNPRLDDNVKSKDGLLLTEYVTKTRDYIVSNHWDYIDIYNGFKDRNADMKNLLADKVHPNDEGYNLWFEIMKSEFEKKK